jgi:pimeloyl-ACP methyl ester carboxylesterase
MKINVRAFVRPDFLARQARLRVLKLASSEEIVACFVLVHGAFYGGWCWQRVAQRLRAAGHQVHTPTLTGCGDRFHLLTREVGVETHVRDLVATLEHEDVADAVLVGHSYGGTVITLAASRVPARVKQLVFIDGQTPFDGQTASGALAEGSSEKLAELSSGDEWLLPALSLDVMEVVDSADIAWVGPRRHPHPMRTLLEPVRYEESKLAAMRKSYIACTRHERLIALFGVDPLLTFVQRAEREGWRVDRLDSGHDPMITAPDALTQLLVSHV